MTSPARTLLDNAPTLTDAQLPRAVNDSRRAGLCRPTALADVLASARVAGDAAIVSTTGHRIVLPPEDLARAVLATHVGGQPLSPGHGYPVRLVVPGRRGYYWVKWLARLDAA